MAQADTYATVSVSTSQIYDDNLFAAAASRDRQADLISRFGPAIEVGYRAIPLKLVARYAVDAERYFNHTEFNKDVARQDGVVDLRYASMQRLALRVRAAYLETQTPHEFNLESQLAVGRARAERVAVSSAATYGWMAASSLNLKYEFAKDALAGATASTTHNMRVGFDRRTGSRDTYRLNYWVRRVGFVDEEDEAETSHLITTGWTHGITQRTGFEVDVGPRLSRRAIRVELSAMLRRRMRRGEVSVAYLRTEATAIGESGTIDVRRVAVGGTYRPADHLTLTVAPALVHSGRDGRDAAVYMLELDAIAQATQRLSLAASARIGRQVGTLAGLRDAIPYRSLAVRLIITLSDRAGTESARNPTL